MSQAVERCGGQQPVGGEGLIPLVEVQVAGDDGGGLLVALGDEVVQVLVGGSTQRLEPEVIDDEQRHPCQSGELALVGAGGARGVQGLRQPAQVANTTSAPWRTAQWPSACARWLLPTPLGPTMSTGAFSCR